MAELKKRIPQVYPRFHANGLPPPGSSSNIRAAFLHPSRNRPLLSEMDPNKLASEQPKLCYWNKLCSRQQHQQFTNTRVRVHVRDHYLRGHVRVFECERGSGLRRGRCRARFAFCWHQKTEESAINSAHNAAALAGNHLRFAKRSRNIPERTVSLIYPFDLRTAHGATSVRFQCHCGQDRQDAAKKPRARRGELLNAYRSPKSYFINILYCYLIT